MAFQITMTVLTHPVQVLLMGMIVSHGVRSAIAVVRETARMRRPVAGRPDLQAA